MLVGLPATMLTMLSKPYSTVYIAVEVAQLVGARLSQAPQPSSAPRV